MYVSNMRKIFSVIVAAIVALTVATMSSCQSHKNFVYLQDLNDSTSFSIKMDKHVKIRPEDRLYVSVNSRDEKTAKLFQQQTLLNTSMMGGNTGERGGYMVEDDGTIDFPILGRIHVAGLSRSEVAEFIKNKIIEQNLLMDPSVLVELGNARVYTLGELGNTTIPITKDHLSIIEAISLAGGLTDDGLRKNIRVIREEDNMLKQYTIDITSADQITESPVYYLRQNDIIYVEPNKRAVIASTEVRSATFWISVITLPLTLLAIFGVKIF